ncbi:MAG: glycosyltransferase, partial [Calditrichaeota bacterium]
MVLFLELGLFRLRRQTTAGKPRVSVVVAARNEAKNIGSCLQALLRQTYPRDLTEIIVVDDRSTDETPQLISVYQQRNPGLLLSKRLTAPEPGVSPKKRALQEGIVLASGEIIQTTDADCVPPPRWIEQTVALFTAEVGIVIGPAPFFPGPSLASKILALDNLAAAFVAAGGAGW